ncbi:unnamed protein product [Hyaloperonospora brassicae]|uniref:Peptidase C1A papain C-terminal domain-containing protein n=1 Tax=Hyaloperonospora brassicae TaxID=162125 RepID=A0AAV0U3N4_HYABA|nr:unnamed protein product [Hyaloperonospora brassicae]
MRLRVSIASVAVAVAVVSLATTRVVEARPMHAAIVSKYHRYLEEKDQVQAELDEWLTEYGAGGRKHGYIPVTESRSTEDELEDQRQRFYMSKQLAKEARAANPMAEFGTQNPFTLMTMDEFQQFLQNSHLNARNKTETSRTAKPKDPRRAKTPWPTRSSSEREDDEGNGRDETEDGTRRRASKPVTERSRAEPSDGRRLREAQSSQFSLQLGGISMNGGDYGFRSTADGSTQSTEQTDLSGTDFSDSPGSSGTSGDNTNGGWNFGAVSIGDGAQVAPVSESNTDSSSPSWWGSHTWGGTSWWGTAGSGDSNAGAHSGTNSWGTAGSGDSNAGTHSITSWWGMGGGGGLKADANANTNTNNAGTWTFNSDGGDTNAGTWTFKPTQPSDSSPQETIAINPQWTIDPNSQITPAPDSQWTPAQDTQWTPALDSQESLASKSQETAASDSQETAASDSQETSASESQEASTSKSGETPAPESQETAASDSQETSASESQETPAPEPQETPAPESQEASNPEPQEISAPESQETPASDSQETASSASSSYQRRKPSSSDSEPAAAQEPADDESARAPSSPSASSRATDRAPASDPARESTPVPRREPAVAPVSQTDESTVSASTSASAAGASPSADADAVDWSTSPCVHAPTLQGQCGSCWAFASISALEAAQCIRNGDKNASEYSKQQLVSCDTKNFGCNGGAPVYALEYLRDNGVCTESSYAYTSIEGGQPAACAKSCTPVKSGIKEIKKIEQGDERALLRAVQQQPVIASVVSNNAVWKQYISGVITSCPPAPNVDHATLVVGYDATTIKIKNSWGTEWGEEGYVRVSRTASGMGTCDVLKDMSYPEL